MTKKISLGKSFKLQAKNSLNGKNQSAIHASLFIYIFAVVFYSIIQAIYYLALKKFDLKPQDFTPFVITSMVIYFLLTIFYYIFLNSTRFAFIKMQTEMVKTNEKQSFKSFLSYLNSWFKAFRAFLYKTLFIFLWTLLFCLVISLIAAGIIILLETKKLNIDAHKEAIIFASVAYILFLPIYIIKSIQYMFQYFILADKEIGVCKALKESVKITRGYKKKIFGFIMSFFGHYLLYIITLGIYGIWFKPYFYTSLVNFYNHIKFNPKDEESIEENKLITSYGSFEE